MDSKDKLDIYRELQKQLEERKKKKVVFQCDYISIEVEVTQGWIYSDWTGYQSKGSVIEGCTQILEAMQKFNIYKILNDNTHIRGHWNAAVEWISETWFPNMIAAGMKRLAWIYAPGEVSHFSADQTIKNVSPNHSIRTFHSIEDGKRWLNGEGSAMAGDGNSF